LNIETISRIKYKGVINNPKYQFALDFLEYQQSLDDMIICRMFAHCIYLPVLSSRVSMLDNVVHLYLSDCVNIIDVSAVGKAKILHLNRCTKIADVSALGNVTELDLSFCTSVHISALGFVRRLSLAG
jgi:hypothetical protein